jgi:hypothetical protein
VELDQSQTSAESSSTVAAAASTKSYTKVLDDLADIYGLGFWEVTLLISNTRVTTRPDLYQISKRVLKCLQGTQLHWVYL